MKVDLAEQLGIRESAALEFKQSAKRTDKIGQAICALANDLCGHGGGDLLIGVRDDGQPLHDVDVSDRQLLALTDFRDDGRILERPCMTVEVVEFCGKPVIRIHVEASGSPPVRYEGVVWVRPGPTTRRASRNDERVLTERRQTLDEPFDTRAIVDTSVDDLDLELFESTYLPAAVAPEVIEENERPRQLQLASLRMAGENGRATATGLLVLGLDPVRLIRGAYVQFVRFGGIDMDAAIIDDQELRHNVIDLAGHLGQILQSNVRTRIVEDTALREEKRPDYPLVALREVCMNAIMHRNYETSYAPVRILWFDDRVEVDNPGGPYGRVNVANFDRTSDFRNPALAAAMRSLGYVNRFGRGIRRIRDSLAKNGNPPPDFLVDQSSWSVTLWKSK